MKKIIVLPLDERPCNYEFNYMLAKSTEYKLCRPPKDIMGAKKIPGNLSALNKWLILEAAEAEVAIIAIDTLLYGGIVPSRLHYLSEEELEKRLALLKKLKSINPKLKILAYSLIMRNPTYSSCDEEPDYYGVWGHEIHRYGYLSHKVELGITTGDELGELENINKLLPKKHLVDYIDRRKVNGVMNMLAVDYVHEGIIDFMIIPQDDASPYGFTAKDQKRVREYIYKKEVALKVYMYPDADAVANTLLARFINEDKGLKPLVYPKYTSVLGPQLIPSYEDRLLGETVKYQILAAGGLVASSAVEADIILIVNAPGGNYLEASQAYKRSIEYDAFRTIIEVIEYADYVVNILKKPCVMGDVAYGNGSDLQLIQLLKQKGLLFKLAGYAGWNTSSNSLGTCIPQGMICGIYGINKYHINFLALRYVEDAGYCGYVRKLVTEDYLPTLKLNYFNVSEKRGQVAVKVKDELELFISKHLKNNEYDIKITDCYMPWERMFEVGLEVIAE